MSQKFCCSSFHIVLYMMVVLFSVNINTEEASLSNKNWKIKAPKVERIEEINSTELGEGPHWDHKTQSLYFVDISEGSIHKYVPATKKYTKAVIGIDSVSIIIPVRGETDKFVISLGRELVVVTWDGESENVTKIEKLYEVDTAPDTIDNQINDGKCDSSGRLWAGTAGGNITNWQYTGSLYSFSNNIVTKHISDVGISNGLAWNDKLRKFYYIETLKFTVDEYDFDITTGTISNPKTIFTLANDGSQGFFDGMTIDTNGNLWIAVAGAFEVIQIDPRKPETILQSIPVPDQVTSVAFGGPNLDELYVTSGMVPIGDNVLSPPLIGGTYKITGLKAKGYPGVRVVL